MKIIISTRIKLCRLAFVLAAVTSVKVNAGEINNVDAAAGGGEGEAVETTMKKRSSVRRIPEKAITMAGTRDRVNVSASKEITGAKTILYEPTAQADATATAPREKELQVARNLRRGGAARQRMHNEEMTKSIYGPTAQANENAASNTDDNDDKESSVRIMPKRFSREPTMSPNRPTRFHYEYGYGPSTNNKKVIGRSGEGGGYGNPSARSYSEMKSQPARPRLRNNVLSHNYHHFTSTNNGRGKEEGSSNDYYLPTSTEEVKKDRNQRYHPGKYQYANSPHQGEGRYYAKIANRQYYDTVTPNEDLVDGLNQEYYPDEYYYATTEEDQMDKETNQGYYSDKYYFVTSPGKEKNRHHVNRYYDSAPKNDVNQHFYPDEYYYDASLTGKGKGRYNGNRYYYDAPSDSNEEYYSDEYHYATSPGSSYNTYINGPRKRSKGGKGHNERPNELHTSYVPTDRFQGRKRGKRNPTGSYYDKLYYYVESVFYRPTNGPPKGSKRMKGENVRSNDWYTTYIPTQGTQGEAISEGKGKGKVKGTQITASGKGNGKGTLITASGKGKGKGKGTLPTPTFDAIIIGAGWAGLKAADTLLASGVSSILILEASDEVGGRSRSNNEFVPGVPTDLGSEWLYEEENEMAPILMSDFGLEDAPTYITDEVSVTFLQLDNDGMIQAEKMSEEEAAEDIEMLWTGENGFRKFLKEKQIAGAADESFAEELAEYEDEKSLGEEDKQVLNMFEDSYLELEYSSNSEELSANTTYYDETYGMRYTAVPGLGYGNTAVSFAEQLKCKIQLNAKVTKIDYEEDDNICITYSENGVTKKVRGRSALVTVSLGVLKAGTINFVPSLPVEKQLAIQNIGFGALNKIVLYWENPEHIVWPRDKLWIELVTTEDETSGRWTSFFNPVEYKDVPMLIGWIAGDDAIEMEEQSDEEVLDDVMKNLSAMFPSICRPTKTLITRWGKNENVRGAYSFQRVGRKFGEDAAILANRTKNLWFAGEATSISGWQATTIGGWETGEEAARSMASALRN